MPWKTIETGNFQDPQAFVKDLITLRREHPRLVCYDRPGERKTVRVYINSTDKDIPIEANPIFTHRYENAILKANGIFICRI